MYIPSLPKAAAASILASSHNLWNSDSSRMIRIPRPPPPAVALMITGYLIVLANSIASSTVSKSPSEPGITGTPAFFMVSFAVALSPIELIISAEAPMNLMPCSEQIRENSAFSERKP